MSLTSPTPVELRVFRAQLGLSQAGLAEALGIAKRTVEDWEGDRRSPPAYLRLALWAIVNNVTAEKLGGSVDLPLPAGSKLKDPNR